MTLVEDQGTLEHHRRAAVALAPSASAVDGDGRTVEVQIVRWETPERVTDDGRTFYTESFARGGLIVAPGARVIVRNEHDLTPFPGVQRVAPGSAPGNEGVVVGTVTSTHIRSDGLYGTIRIVDNDDGRRLLGLIDPTAPVIDRLSVDFEDRYRPIRAGQHVVRTEARLLGLDFTLSPQRGDARVLAVRSLIQENNDMDTETTPGTQVPETASDDTTTQQSVRSVTAPAPQGAAPPAATTQHVRSAPQPGPAAGVAIGDGLTDGIADLQFLRQFRSLGHFVQSAARARDDGADENGEYARHGRALLAGVEQVAGIRRHRRAFEDATTADIAGLLPPTWINELIDLYQVLAPTVSNWSTTPMTETGLVISQPAVTARPTMAVQAAQYDQPSSNKVEIGTVSWTIGTYSGGQGMSLQTALRSTPDYLSIVMRLYSGEAMRAWNAVVAAGLFTASDDVNATALEYTTAETFPDLVIDASATFLGALGRPAEVVALSIPLWAALGKAKDGDDRYMFPDIAGMNVVGSFDATSPQGQIRKVSYYVEPSWGTVTIKGVVGVREAYRTATGAMQFLSADVPSELSRDVAAFLFGAHGKADATGLMQIANAA